MEATVCSNSRPNEFHKFELLDSCDSDGSNESEDELAEGDELAESEDENIEISESEIESLAE
ncbi:13161_t:CDS:1, partial [Racocetra fulgida]